MGEKSIRWGVLGTARIAEKVGAAIQNTTGAQLVAVASRNLERAESWGRPLGYTQFFGDYEALLRDPSIDAVYIPLPPALHCEWTIKAAQHGKHVLCEKPMAVDAAQVRDMIAACQAHNVQLMDGTMWSHHGRAQVMQSQLPRLGELRRLTAAFSFRWPTIPTDDIRLNPDLAGGCLGDLGWYCVRASLWAFGELPRRVFADARYFQGVDMNLSALLWYSGDRMASFDCGFDVILRQWLEVAGTTGTLVCDDFVLPKSPDESRWWLHPGADLPAETHTFGPCTQEVQMISSFCDLIRTHSTTSPWPSLTLSTQTIVDALALSARTHSPVDL